MDLTFITIRSEGLGPITNTVAHTVVPELEVVTNPSSNKGVREEDEPGTNIQYALQCIVIICDAGNNTCVYSCAYGRGASI